MRLALISLAESWKPVTGIETLAVIIGGFAALGALIWTMMGNPNILSWLQKRLKDSPPASHSAKRHVLNVEWGQLEAAAAAFATKNSVTYDLVVGVQPDGISLANLLASRLQTRYAAIEKRYLEARRVPFFVFDQEKYSRSVRVSKTEFSPPSDIMNPSHILVVDGVTTFGNGLLKAEEEVLKKFDKVHVDFYVFAIDQIRLAACHPEIVDRVAFHIVIDNYVTWLHFPWDAT